MCGCEFLHPHFSTVWPYNHGTGAGGNSDGEKADVEDIATDSGDSITGPAGRQRLFLLPMSSSWDGKVGLIVCMIRQGSVDWRKVRIGSYMWELV